MEVRQLLVITRPFPTIIRQLLIVIRQLLIIIRQANLSRAVTGRAGGQAGSLVARQAGSKARWARGNGYNGRYNQHHTHMLKTGLPARRMGW